MSDIYLTFYKLFTMGLWPEWMNHSNQMQQAELDTEMSLSHILVMSSVFLIHGQQNHGKNNI